MGTLMHPVGPLPPGAYWLRRLVAALAVIVVVVLAWWAWGALTGDGGGSSPTPSLTTSPGPSTASSTPSATASPTATPKPTATATPSPAATTAAVAALCPAAAIEVTVATDRTSYSAGQRPKITLTVTNTGSSACRRDVGQKALELQISTGGKRFWSSDDCAPGGGASLRLLGPDASYRTIVVWQRTGSQPGCPADRPAAPAGEYQVVGRDLDVRSEPATFTLR